MLALRGSDRWLLPEGAYSTKNQFDFNRQVHYADYSSRTSTTAA